MSRSGFIRIGFTLNFHWRISLRCIRNLFTWLTANRLIKVSPQIVVRLKFKSDELKAQLQYIMEFSCQKFRGGDGTKINIYVYVHVLVRVSVWC